MNLIWASLAQHEGLPALLWSNVGSLVILEVLLLVPALTHDARKIYSNVCSCAAGCWWHRALRMVAGVCVQ